MIKDAALGAACVTMALVLMVRTSAAQGKPTSAPVADSEAVSLLYEDSPPPNCPKQAEFEAEVIRLTTKAHFTQQRGARRVRIELSTSGHDVVGRLISGDGKNQASREVRGKDCQEVSSALAIAVALTIDPEALLGDSGSPAETRRPATAEAPPPKSASEPTPPVRPAPLPPAAPAAPAAPAPLKLVWGLGAGLELENAWGPQMSPGVHGFLVCGIDDRLSFALGVTRFVTRKVDDASFGAWLAESSVSVNLALLGALRPFALASYELGAVDAIGAGLPAPVQAQRPWQAASAGLGLRYETESFFFQLAGSLLVPLSRQRYLVSDPVGKIRTLYEVPSLGLKQETSLGVFL